MFGEEALIVLKSETISVSVWFLLAIIFLAIVGVTVLVTAFLEWLHAPSSRVRKELQRMTGGR